MRASEFITHIQIPGISVLSQLLYTENSSSPAAAATERDHYERTGGRGRSTSSLPRKHGIVRSFVRSMHRVTLPHSLHPLLSILALRLGRKRAAAAPLAPASVRFPLACSPAARPERADGAPTGGRRTRTDRLTRQRRSPSNERKNACSPSSPLSWTKKASRGSIVR